MKFFSWVAGIVLAAGVAGAGEDVLPVWNMDDGLLNALGGGYNAFAAGGSEASVHLPADVRRGAGGRSMKIVYGQESNGYCGAWMHLFDEQAPAAQRRFLDVSRYPFLSFHVRGEEGGEDFVVQVADADWLAKDDSKPVGPVSRYLRGGIATNWQEVVIPAADFWVDASQLAGVTFNFTTPGRGTVYIDDVCFKTGKETRVEESDSAGVAAPPPAQALARAMWVWEIEPLLGDEAQRAELFDFCGEHGVDELFLQVAYVFENDLTTNVQCVLRRPGDLRALLAEASARGIRVHALDGYPEFVRRSQHPRVLALVRAIADYNEASEPAQRYAGIHLDNEPYQILGFDGPQRAGILIQFLELNEKVVALLRERNAGIVYGVDIPFWFDETEAGGAPRAAVTFKGVRKDAAQHVIDIVDNVGIMDYRNFAGGVDGMIYHALGEMDYADRAGKKVYLGVETFRYEPTPVHFVFGPPEPEWQAMQRAHGLLLASSMDGFKVRTITDGRRRYVGLAEPPGLEDRAALEKALVKLYGHLGATMDGRMADLDELAGAADAALRQNPEYRGMTLFSLKDGEGRVVAAGFRTTEEMLPKITFAGKTKAEMESVLAEVAEFFAGRPAFVGFAVHHYGTWKVME